MRRISKKIALPLILGLASIIAAACDGTPNDDDDGGSGGRTDLDGSIGGEGGESSSGGSGGSGGTTNGTGGGEGGDGPTGTGGEETGGQEVEKLPHPAEPSSTYPDGVLEGKPCFDLVTYRGVSDNQFYNQCSGTAWAVFDNEARIENFPEDYEGLQDLPPL